MTYQHILYDVSEKIATITLHRPERMNAWTPIMERDVRDAMESAAAASMAWRTSRSMIGVHAFMRSGRWSVMVAIFSLTS